MKILLLICLAPLSLVGQVDTDDSWEIVEQNYFIPIDKLSPDWRTIEVDTASPTKIMADFNGDGKTDICGLYTGYSPGLYIVSDVNGSPEMVYNFPFDSTWRDETGYLAVLSIGKKGETIETMNKENIQIARQDYIKVYHLNGRVDAIFYSLWELHKVRLSTPVPKRH